MTPAQTLTATGRALREFVLALGVMALIFLSFGHQPVSAGTGDTAFRFADGSTPVFCGSGDPAGEGHAQGPCHACRVQTAGLPLPPCDAAPAFAGFTSVVCPPAEPAMAHRAPHALKAPRAPPAPV